MHLLRNFLFICIITLTSLPLWAEQMEVKINGVSCTVIAPDQIDTRKGVRASTTKSANAISYSQATISPTYTNGKHAGKQVVNTPESAIAKFEPIRVFDTNPNLGQNWECGQTYTLDNRRLWVAKHYDKRIKTTNATVREIMDAIDNRRDFLVVYEGQTDIESCASGEIYFDRDEAIDKCFEDSTESSSE